MASTFHDRLLDWEFSVPFQHKNRLPWRQGLGWRFSSARLRIDNNILTSRPRCLFVQRRPTNLIICRCCQTVHKVKNMTACDKLQMICLFCMQRAHLLGYHRRLRSHVACRPATVQCTRLRVTLKISLVSERHGRAFYHRQMHLCIRHHYCTCNKRQYFPRTVRSY